MRGKALITALPEALKARQEAENLRRIEYEQLRAIAKSAAQIGAGGYYDIGYDDIINPKPEDKRSAEEIVNDIITRAGLEVIPDECTRLGSEADARQDEL